MLRSVVNMFTIRGRFISNALIDILPEVQTCIRENKPVVALESTIITHGMPYPENIETALKCQDIIRSEGCVPAIIAILNGRIKVGLDIKDLEFLARGGSGKTVKTSRRDFPYVLAKNLDGGTTVSGTVIIANSVGIKVFATGGIGGVHRRGESTFDISADLTELGKNPVMVVSSGIKSILDIGRTLEYLETQGVLVSTYSSDRSMPAFFSHNSAFKAPYNIISAEEGALLIDKMVKLNYQSGILLAVPIPRKYSFDYDLMEAHINKAIEEADDNNISGKNITPYLLGKIKDLTKGQSLKSNIELIVNNSKIAAKIAYSYSNMHNKQSNRRHIAPEKTPIVIGGNVVDYTVSLCDEAVFDGRTVKATIEQFCGGVGRNIADSLGKLGTNTSLISAVGNDHNGNMILKSVSHLDSESIEVLRNETTASYTVLLDGKGDCLLCAGNSEIHDRINSELIKRYLQKIDNSNFIILDSNIPQDTMEFIIDYASKLSIPIWMEPTSLLKCHKLLACPSVNSVNYISPNLTELKQMALYLGGSFEQDFDFTSAEKILEQAIYLSKILIRHIKSNLMITMGEFGLLMVGRSNDRNEEVKHSARYYPSLVPTGEIINSSGAGDCGAAGFISAILQGLPEAKCVTLAHLSSCASLISKSPVPEEFLEISNDVEPAKFITIPLQ